MGIRGGGRLLGGGDVGEGRCVFVGGFDMESDSFMSVCLLV